MSGPGIHDDYPEWLRFFFNRPQTQGRGWWDSPLPEEGGDAAVWDAICEGHRLWGRDRPRLTALLTRTLKNCKEDLASFSPDQVGDGLWYLLTRGDYFRSALVHQNPPSQENEPSWEEKRGLIRACETLFADYLSPMFHANSIPPRLRDVGEFWWEFFPPPNPIFTGTTEKGIRSIYVGVGAPETPPTADEVARSQAYYDEVLGVMERLLERRDVTIFHYVYWNLETWNEPTGKARALGRKYAPKG